MSALLLIFSLLQNPAAPAQTAPPPLEMKTYQMVFLRNGSKTGIPTNLAEIRQGHLANMIALHKKGVNVMFGPFTDEADPRGVAIVDAPDGAAAIALFAEDPLVKGGYMVAEAKPWMGPKGWFGQALEPNTPEPFILGVLMRGPNTSQPAEEAQKIQEGHLAYMDALYKQGKLVVAGPFADNGNMRGLVIYRVATVEEAKQLAADDPAVKAGRLVLVARPWMTFKGIIK